MHTSGSQPTSSSRYFYDLAHSAGWDSRHGLVLKGMSPAGRVCTINVRILHKKNLTTAGSTKIVRTGILSPLSRKSAWKFVRRGGH